LVLIGSVEEVVDIVHFLGAAEELVLGIGAGGALAGRRGAGAVHLDAQDIGGRVVAGQQEGLVSLASHRVCGRGTAHLRVAIGHQDGEMANGRAIVVRGIGIDVGLLGVHRLAVPHIDAPLHVVGNVQRIVVAHPGQILARPVEGVCVVASVVAHRTALHVQGGQVGQLVVPLDGGHPAGAMKTACLNEFVI